MMKNILDTLLDVPITDPETRRRAQLLAIVLIGVAIVSVVALLILIVTDLFGLATNSIVLYLGSLLVLIGDFLILVMSRRGRVDSASIFLLALLTVVFTFADTPQNVVQGRTLFMFVIPIFMASFLLRPSASFIMAIAISVIHVAVAALYDVPDYSPIGLVAFLVIALIAWLVSSNLETALAELRIINRLLDQRVIERTKELALANQQLETQAKELVQVNLQLEQQAHELADANVRLTELDVMKSKFVSDVSHELRTPISNLKIYLEMLEEARPEKRERYRAVLQEETDRLGTLVSDILDLSRMEMGAHKVEFSWLDINELVTSVVAANRLRAEAKGLLLSFNPQKELPEIWGDVNQLKQAVNNLVSNAINYTNEGSVQIETRLDSEQEHICLRIHDSGLGIDDEDMPHLFDRFYRGKHAGQSTIPGTGLGLAITKEIINVHGGQIEVQSELGEGSTFVLIFPLGQ